jgi:hypothetical protein
MIRRVSGHALQPIGRGESRIAGEVVNSIMSSAIGPRVSVIAHIVSTRWDESAFAQEISGKWSGPEQWHRKARWVTGPLEQGDIQWDMPEMDVAIVSMVCKRVMQGINFDAVPKCLHQLAVGTQALGVSVIHMPMFGPKVQAQLNELIRKTMPDLDVFVYGGKLDRKKRTKLVMRRAS